MNATQVLEKSLEEQKKPLRMIETGSFAEGIAGLGAVVLSILALIDIFPALFLSISVIALGISLFVEGGAVAGRFAAFIDRYSEGKLEARSLGAGGAIESLGGIAGIVLGVLALLGVIPALLTSVAVIVFGAALVFGSGATAYLNSLIISRSGENIAVQRVAGQMLSAAADIRLLIGLGAIALGVLAVAGINPMTLTLIAMIGVGASAFLDATAIGGRMLSIFRRP